MSNLLVADGHLSDAVFLASALRIEGFNVHLASSSSEALALVSKHSIAIAIVDLVLDEHGINGLELARRVHLEHPSTRVLLTGAYHLSERQLAQDIGKICGFVPKPYDVAEVVSFVRAKVEAPPMSQRVPRNFHSASLDSSDEESSEVHRTTRSFAATSRPRR